MAHLDHDGFKDQTGMGTVPQVLLPVDKKVEKDLELVHTCFLCLSSGLLLLVLSHGKQMVLWRNKHDQEISELFHKGTIKFFDVISVIVELLHNLKAPLGRPFHNTARGFKDNTPVHNT